MAFNLFGKKKKPARPDDTGRSGVKDEKPKKADVVTPAPDATGEQKSAKKAVPVLVHGADVLKYQHVSEKSAMGEALGKYTFIVEPTATKSEIAKAVAARYNVEVDGVNIVRLRGKSRRIGRYTGSTNSRKKAIVTLKKGNQIASTV